MKAYNGNEPYIFISYAHKDSAEVIKILEQLEEQGYRIWYDEGIEPGSEWPEYIANKLNDCGAFLAFITENSANSINCRREINYALSKDKPFLWIPLSDTTITPGLELQLSTQQSIIKYKYKTDEEFLSKFITTKMFDQCREKVEYIEEEVVKEPKVKKVKKLPAPKKKKFSPLYFIPVIAAIIACVMIFGGSGSENSSSKVTSDIIDVSYSTGKIASKKVDATIVDEINRIDKVNILEFKDCTFDEGSLEKIDWSKITYLTIQNTPLKSLDFLKEAKIIKLTLDNCGITNDLLDSLQNLNLTEINLPNNQLTSLEFFCNLEKLTKIDLSNNHIVSPSIPFMSVNITEIRLANNELTNLDFLSGIKNTTIFDIANNKISDISIIQRVIDKLSQLNISNNPITDISLVKNAVNMKLLKMDGIANDLSVVKEMSNLNTLSAANCNITSIDVLSNCIHLKWIDLSNNAIVNIDALNTMVENYLDINLCNNKVTSVSSLKDVSIRNINLLNNPVVFTSDTKIAKTMMNFYCDYHESFKEENLNHFAYHYYLQNAPEMTKATIKSDIKANEINFGTFEELNQKFLGEIA